MFLQLQGDPRIEANETLLWVLLHVLPSKILLLGYHYLLDEATAADLELLPPQQWQVAVLMHNSNSARIRSSDQNLQALHAGSTKQMRRDPVLHIDCDDVLVLQHRWWQPIRIECVPHNTPLPSEFVFYYIYFLANVLHCAIFLQESTGN